MLIQASEVAPANETKTDPAVIQEARQGRQYGPYGPYGSTENEVVVDIQDDEKNQYYETNFDTSKDIFNLPFLKKTPCLSEILFR